MNPFRSTQSLFHLSNAAIIQIQHLISRRRSATRARNRVILDCCSSSPLPIDERRKLQRPFRSKRHVDPDSNIVTHYPIGALNLLARFGGDVRIRDMGRVHGYGSYLFHTLLMGISQRYDAWVASKGRLKWVYCTYWGR